MKHSIICFKASSGEKIYGNSWLLTDKQPRASVIICHGMAEHSKRYGDFAKFLCENDLDVFAVDHVGHGLNVSKKPDTKYKYGMWPENGFDVAINQLVELVRYIRKKSNKPILLFGHSMGSFVAQGLYQRHSDLINGVVFCGSSANTSLYKMSRNLTSIMRIFRTKKNRDKVCPILVNSGNKTFNKGLKPFPDGYDSINKWISINEDNVKKYDKDPECGFACSFNFYYSLFKGQQEIFKKKNLKNIKNKCNIFIISGELDPVGGYGKNVERLKDFYMQGQDNVEMKLYPGVRHEILNEDIKDEVYKDVVNFFNHCLN
ncbi:MAG: alpha/beta fold hydrolase [Bacilli bacterium]